MSPSFSLARGTPFEVGLLGEEELHRLKRLHHFVSQTVLGLVDNKQTFASDDRATVRTSASFPTFPFQ
jgi:hypothetical protein